MTGGRAVRAVLALASVIGLFGTFAPAAEAKPARPATGVQHLHYKFGPVDIKPGQNLIQFSKGEVPKPTEDGWVVGIRPNLRRDNGTVPPVDVIHLHHGVWVNMSKKDATSPHLPERFFAAGEEKTGMQLPAGFGYPYQASDNWLINYMIHDLTEKPEKVSITYDIDFIPASSPAAQSIRAARPIWMDVQNGSIYPVFDVNRGAGQDGTFTYPDQASDPYKGGEPKNQWTVDADGVLIGTGGHLHPGGFHDDLFLQRGGAAAAPGSPAEKSVNGDTAHLFRSQAHYFEPAGAVSWDVAMSVTNRDWRVAVHPGDVLKMSTTYDSKRASWYEVMGIMIAWMADGTDGADPFQTPVDKPGHLTHGHLPENNNHGGKGADLPDARKVGGTQAQDGGSVPIAGFIYGQGDLNTKTKAKVPVVAPGQALTFTNGDVPDKGPGIPHSITACKAPCNQSTGIAYPLADGSVQFDSGQLGNFGPPSSGQNSWTTPDNLAPGTYTYFCRIHPFMRGAFRVVKK